LCSLSRTSGSVSRLDIVDRSDDRPNSHPGDKRHLVNDFVAKSLGKSVLIFTDGSVRCSQERGVGPGACAAVMCPLQGDGREKIFTKAVGKHTDILSCEVEGIVLGVEKVVEYYRGTCFRKTEEVLYILCDCDRAIDCILEKSFVLNNLGQRHFDALLTQLEQVKVKVFLVWIPSHSDIAGNEIADSEAKQVAREIEIGRTVVHESVKLNSTFVLSSKIARQSWQREWDQGTSGTVTRQLIPEVCSKVCFPTTRNVGMSYCRMLLNNTMLNEDGFRTQVSDSPVCDCGMDYESVEHFLLECKTVQ